MLNTASSSRVSSTLRTCFASPSLNITRGKKTNKGSFFPKQPKLYSYRPRIPKIRSPHDLRVPSPQGSTATAQPYEMQPWIPKTTSVAIDNTPLRLYHSPPSSAPSVTNGAVPTFLSWLGGSPVTLTGEETAPRRSGRTRESRPEGYVPAREWSEETKSSMIQMRAEGKSTREILSALNLPLYQRNYVAAIAPETPEAREARAAKDLARLGAMGYRKRVLYAIRERRKDFW